MDKVSHARLLAEALLSERGDASGAVIAQELEGVLAELSSEDQLRFALFVATEFVPDAERLREAAEAYLNEPSAPNAQRLANAAEPPRQELLRRINMSPAGTATLVALRRSVLQELAARPELETLDEDLRHLFLSWFNRGFIELRRIDWDTPAAVLEKLIEYEAVHQIKGWDDLRRRLDDDRRCFAFFHPALPGEPLTFVSVGLVKGLAGAIQPLLDCNSASDVRCADTAIFYSISNCQDGLRGVSFGNLLIKQVVEELKRELPQLRQFATLSPVPGFRRWLSKLPGEGDGLLTEVERAMLAGAAPAERRTPVLASLLNLPHWWEQPALVKALRGPLTCLCAKYLTSTSGPRAALDPVARFHLGNGARLERINWLGNSSERGIRESFGLMVNYLYDPEAIEANHEAYVRDGRVACSQSVTEILARPEPRADRITHDAG